MASFSTAIWNRFSARAGVPRSYSANIAALEASPGLVPGKEAPATSRAIGSKGGTASSCKSRVRYIALPEKAGCITFD